MKRISKAIIPLAITFFLVNLLSAQENMPVEWLNTYKGEVSTGTYTYMHDYTYFNKELCGINIKTFKVDKKGVESNSHVEIYLTDIDENSLKFKVTGKYLTVSMQTKNSQKFIKSFDNNVFKGYISSLDIYTDEVDKARDMVAVFKKHLADCKQQEKTWSSLKENVGWLASNISKTTKGSTEYNQSFTYDAAKNYLSVLTRKYNDAKGIEITEEHSFNLADINPDKISLGVSGKDLSVELKMKNDNKYVRTLKNGTLQNYSNSVDVLVPDLETARNIVQAFKYAGEQSKPVYKSFSDANQALNYLQENIKDITSGSNNYQQVLEYESKPDGIVTFISKNTDSKGVTTEEKYQLYLNELIPNVDLNISGKDILIKLNVKDKQKLIKTTKNGELQNYTGQVEIYTDNIEAARELSNAMNYAILNRDAGIQKWADTGKAAAWAISNTGTITESGKTYKQKLSIDPSNGNKITLSLTTTDSNGDTEETYELYIADVDKGNINLSVSGKKMLVKITTGKEKLIKVTKLNQIQNYSSSVDVIFDDTKQARNFISAIKYIAENSKTSEKTFADSPSAFKYIASSLQPVSTGTYTIEQTIEMVDNNSCKLKLSAIQLDSKNTSTGFVYEFNLSDINAEGIKLEISGKEMRVKLETKGKQKLIKPYKNGDVQNFTSDMVIYADDVAVARNMINAFKAIAKRCSN